MSLPVSVSHRLGHPWILLLLVVGMVFWGWWLAALALPWGTILGLALILVYLLGVGMGGVIPASVFCSMGVAALVALDYFPEFWPTNLHYKYWALTLMVLWAAALGYVCLVAKQGSDLRQRPPRDRRWAWGITLGMMLLAMQGGRWIYQAGWLLG
jgi:hypothetical protein